MQVKGRYLVLAWTAVFLAAAGAIVVRERRGWELRRRLDTVNDHLKVLEDMRAELEGSIAALGSRDSLVPRARALGLRIASDTELVQLPVPVVP